MRTGISGQIFDPPPSDLDVREPARIIVVVQEVDQGLMEATGWMFLVKNLLSLQDRRHCMQKSVSVRRVKRRENLDGNLCSGQDHL